VKPLKEKEAKMRATKEWYSIAEGGKKNPKSATELAKIEREEDYEL